ncbi:MAG: insulinase family protein [Deltaproteobacteria bacterium]|nr:insulinase family protein [Deltaproteobacteria bacterium]
MRPAAVAVLALSIAACHAKPPKAAAPVEEPPAPGPGDDLPEAGRDLDALSPAWGIQAAGGMRVMIVPDQEINQIELGLRIQAGSMDDPPGKEGLAHLVEHLMFYLRRDPRGPTLDERLRAVTSSYNATTDLDGTHYVAHVAPADADVVAALFAEVASEATCAHLDRKALEHERAIVLGERRLRVGRASQIIGDALREVAYPAHHPYRTSGIGSAASLDAITWDDVCTFLAAHYTPASAFPVLSGPIERPRAFALSKAFDAITAPTIATPPKVAAATPAGQRVVVRAPIDEDRLYLVWPLPSRYDEHGLAAAAITARFGGARAIASRDGKIGDVELARTGGARAPILVVAIDLDGDSPAQVIAAVKDVIGHLWDKVTDDDAFMLRLATLHALYAGLVDIDGRTSTWADYLQFDTTLGMITTDLENARQLSRDTLPALSKELLDLGRAGQVQVTATDDDAALDDHTRISDLWTEPRTVTPLATALPPAPAPRSNVRTMVLPNGLTVVLAPDRFVPLMRARLVIPAGRLDDGAAPGTAVLAAITLDTPEKGPGRYGNAGQFVQSGLMDLSIGVGATATTFEVSSLTILQDFAVWGLAHFVTRSHTDRDRLTRLRKRFVESLEGDRRDDELQRAAMAAVYGEHPITSMPEPTKASLTAITAAALERFRTANYRPTGAVLVLTGDFSWSLMEEHLKVAFADWHGDARAPVPPAQPPTRATWIGYEDDDDDVTIFARLPVALATPRAEALARVAAAVLDERVGAVRARLGAAYAMEARLSPELIAPAIAISGAVDGDRAEPGLALVAGAIAAVRKGALTDDEILRARVRVVRELQAEITGDSFAADTVAFAQRGLPIDHDVEVAKEVLALPATRLGPELATVFGGAQMTVLSGRAPSVAAGFHAFGAVADPMIRRDATPAAADAPASK